jgi:hypothetical protein
MKTIGLGTLAAFMAATSIGAAAVAQPYSPPPVRGDQVVWGAGGVGDIDHRIDWMQRRIDRGRVDGSLDHREYRRVRGQLDAVRDQYRRARLRHGGRLDDRSRQMLAASLDHVNDEIHWLKGADGRHPW